MFRRITTISLLSTAALLTMPKVYAQGDNKPLHHDGNKFKNPWPSFIPFGFTSVIKMLSTNDLRGTTKRIKAEDITKKVDINWNLLRKKDENEHDKDITATWLGHACVFLQLKKFNVVFDPIFSDSYDHMDAGTINQIDKLHPNCKFYVPLGNKRWFTLSNPLDSQGNERVIELDWWDSEILEKSDASIKLTCTPAQHQSGRTLFDKDKTLWSSWCVEALDERGNATDGKVFFGGDTGYRAIPADTKPESEYDYEYLDTLPHCPAFKEIGEKVGPFDLALIPIGAYSPRWFMSSVHCSPEDAVDVHRDIKSKHSVNIYMYSFFKDGTRFLTNPFLI
ncbi:MAG: beta-lactamase superfamily domain-containing protein [Benjaminiella poitrasii]|nr:MAG: beta-lactamase superfamily domain-containing protein [Benjaminiella poitrasii]